METWPASLPQSPEASGYHESYSDVRVRTSMDKGPTKQRRRHTAKITTFNMVMKLTSTQIDTLNTFWDTTLGGGVDSFIWKHPRTDAANTMRFVSTIDVGQVVASDTYQVVFVVEELPS
ncbi:hypothetical protein LCGC14_1443920 [marine sediment metagenome]|uniref:Phage minor tail protein n=1 Tax=marine sediment metagenome TaxID=412755 RepID=A0A0F9JJS8_9ZZZZ